MKIISAVTFILKIFIIILILLTFKFMTRNVQRGFICGDPSLSLERRRDTVTNLMLIFWGSVPPLIFVISEFIIERKKCENLKVVVRLAWRNIAFLSHRYLLNMLCMHIIVMSVKMFAAAHRPHFFDTCKPNTLENCTLGTFVSKYKCTNELTNRVDIYDASWSFFSGHAATCIYSCLFVAWYIQRRFSEKLLLIPIVQTFLLCLGLYGSLSRIFDHRHHWWDVLTGIIVGVITTIHTAYVLCNNQCHVTKTLKGNGKLKDSNEIVNINVNDP